MPAPGATLAETHISLVLAIGERVYKLKKPVRLDFVDQSTRAARERLCHREVELNRRLAPDVYLGVADVLDPDGKPCDHLVVMRRMPEHRRLSSLVRAGAVEPEELQHVARAIAAFHGRAPTSAEIAASGTAAAQQARWDRTFETMRGFPEAVVAGDVEARVRLLATEYLTGRQALFDDRITRGKIRDGHGDLLADDIYCLDDGPRILDCIEFDDRLRYGDVLADVGFLAMDLERLGAPDLGARLLGWYREFAGETYPVTLAEHYLAYRAHVRAMVAALRVEQGVGGSEAADEARRLLAIARAHLERGRVPIVLVGGLPGTGKSTLAAGLAERFGWSVLRTDEIRKSLAGVAPTSPAGAPFGEGLYRSSTSRSTYEELVRRATSLVELGEPVVLDASWTDGRHRARARAAARETSSPLVELECRVAEPEAARRLRRRARVGGDASDATPEVARSMAARADPWPDATVVATDAPPRLVLERAVAALRAALERPPA